MALIATLPLIAQQTGVRGVVVDAKSGLPVVGATVMLDNQGNAATTDATGKFLIDDARQGSDELLILSYGYKDWVQAVTIIGNVVDCCSEVCVEQSV